jgi:Resolvase, N terminal domain
VVAGLNWNVVLDEHRDRQERQARRVLQSERRRPHGSGLGGHRVHRRRVSGAKERRPTLDAMLGAVRARKVDVVAVVKLDRLARSTRHLVTLAAELEALRVDLVVLDQAIDTTTPAGRLLFHVLASIAEFERDLIRDRVLAGMRRARAQGRRLGRPRVHRVKSMRTRRASCWPRAWACAPSPGNSASTRAPSPGLSQRVRRSPRRRRVVRGFGHRSRGRRQRRDLRHRRGGWLMPRKPVAEPVIRLYAQLGLRLPAPPAMRLKRFCAASGQSLNAVTQAALVRYLDAEERRTSKK